MNEHNDLAHENGNETGTTSLQPMDFTDILDGVFSLYRTHFTLFLRIIAVYFLLTLLMDFISMSVRFNAAPITTLVVNFLAVAGSYIVIFWVAAALVYASAQVYLNREVTFQEALKLALRRLLTYLGSIILWLLVVCGLFITVIGIPFSIYFGVRWGFYGIPVLLEKTTARQALRRSTELVKGTWWRAFGIMLAISLIAIMIQFILMSAFVILTQITGNEDTTLLETLRRLFIPSPSEIEWGTFTIQRIITIGITALTMPISAIGSTLLYFDFRIRKEAFDIEMQVTN